MTRPILLANFVASWHPDPSARERHTALIRDQLAIPVVHVLPSGWVVGIKPLPRTSADEVFSAAQGLVVLHGPASMGVGTESGEVARLSDRVRHRPLELGECSGDFALAAFGLEGECALVSTPAALPPLYFAQDGPAVTVASRLDWITALRPNPPIIDRLPLALWAAGTPQFLDGRTVIQSIRRMRRGAQLHLGPGASPTETNLTTVFLGQPGADRALGKVDVAQALRQHVLHKLETELVSDGLNLLSLSGGLDSSTLAALARTMGKPFKAVTLLAADPQVREHELPYIRAALGERYPENWIEIPWPHKEYQTEVLAKAPAILHPVLHPVLCEMQDLQRDHPIVTYFGGEFCDELIGGSGVIAEWCADTPLMAAWQRTPIRMQGWTFGFRQYLAQRLSTARRRPPLAVPPSLAAHFDDELRREYSSWLGSYRRHSPRDPAGLTLSRWQDICTPVIDMNWEASSQLNIRRSFPLIGREVLGLLWRTSASLRLGPDYKELFRQAFAQDAPASILNRPDKGFWGKFLALAPAAPSDRTGRLPPQPTTGIIGAGKVEPYVALPGTGGYALQVAQRVSWSVHRYRETGDLVIQKQTDKGISSQLEATAQQTRNGAQYEAPHVVKSGNISSVTQGGAGALPDVANAGSA